MNLFYEPGSTEGPPPAVPLGVSSEWAGVAHIWDLFLGQHISSSAVALIFMF